MSESLRRIQYVTTYYEWVQGLRVVPMGVLTLALAPWLAMNGPGKLPKEHVVLWALACVLALVLHAALGVFYRRRFGDVRMSATTRRRMVWATAVSALLATGLGVGAGLVRKHTGLAELTPLIGMLPMGAIVIYYWHLSGRVAHHYLAVGVVVMVLGVLDVLLGSPVCAVLDLQASSSFEVAEHCMSITLALVAGVATIVAGVLDHRLLVRMMGAPPESESEEAAE